MEEKEKLPVILLKMIKEDCKKYYDELEQEQDVRLKSVKRSTPPTRQCNLVDQYINEYPEDAGLISEYDNARYDKIRGNAQAKISKALARMEDANLVYKNEKKCYLPIENPEKKIIKENEILKSIVFDKPTAFQRSPYEILLPVHNQLKAKKLFRDFIGEEYLYDMIEWGDYLIVLMDEKPENSEESKQIIRELKAIVKNGAHSESDLSKVGIINSPFVQRKKKKADKSVNEENTKEDK